MAQPPAPPTEGVKKYELYPTQYAFVHSEAKFPCMSGGFANGKTLAACIRALMWASHYPGSVGLIGRLTYQELEDSTQKAFLDLLPPWALDKKYGGVFRRNEGYLELPQMGTGLKKSIVMFRHMDAISEFELRSMNLTWFYVDQAEEIPEEVFLALVGRIGRSKETVGKPSGWITVNPAPGWVKEHFKTNPWPETSLYEATTMDNPHTNRSYIDTLMKIYPQAWIDRYILGKWDTFEGQIFANFSDDLIKEPPPESEWAPEMEIIAGIDHGLRNPTACVWAMIDWAGRIWVFQEYQQTEGLVSGNCKNIKELSKRFKRVWYYIDPSTAARDPNTGIPLIGEYSSALGLGESLQPANNDVDAGIARLTELFATKGIFVSKNCPELIKQLQGYRWQPKKASLTDPKEMPLKVDDHLVDALRYLVMTRPPPSKPRIEEPGGRTFDRILRDARNRRTAQSLIGRGQLSIA